MKQYITLFILLCIYTCSMYGQDSPPEKKSFFDDFSWNLDLLSFVRTTHFSDELESINPENRIAELSELQGGLFIRPNLKYKKKRFTIWADPRFNNLLEKETGKIDAELYFQQLKVKLQLHSDLYIAGGRYLKQFGTSLFINPSNPFFINSGRLNPKIEIRPRDFIELNLSTKKNWDFTLIANVSKGETPVVFDTPFFEFSNRYGLLSEYYADSYNIGTIFSMTEDERYHLGFYGQKNVNEALLVWVDSAFEYNANRFYPVRGHQTGLIPYEMVNSTENETGFFSGLVGASYTLSFGPTVNLEYYYNGKGYSDQETAVYNEMIASASNFNFDITRNLSDLNLGRALNTGMPYNRRNYIFSQIGENDLFGQLNYNVRYFYSLDDQSSQLSALIEWNALDNLEVFAVVLSDFGEEQSDFKKLLDNQLMFGLIYRL